MMILVASFSHFNCCALSLKWKQKGAFRFLAFCTAARLITGKIVKPAHLTVKIIIFHLDLSIYNYSLTIRLINNYYER